MSNVKEELQAFCFFVLAILATIIAFAIPYYILNFFWPNLSGWTVFWITLVSGCFLIGIPIAMWAEPDRHQRIGSGGLGHNDLYHEDE